MALLSTPTALEAVDIWIMKWKGNPVVDITSKYHCDPRRCYEIFYGDRHNGSREIAFQRILKSEPILALDVATGKLDPKRRRKTALQTRQLRLFE